MRLLVVGGAALALAWLAVRGGAEPPLAAVVRYPVLVPGPPVYVAPAYGYGPYGPLYRPPAAVPGPPLLAGGELRVALPVAVPVYGPLTLPAGPRVEVRK